MNSACMYKLGNLIHEIDTGDWRWFGFIAEWRKEADKGTLFWVACMPHRLPRAEIRKNPARRILDVLKHAQVRQCRYGKQKVNMLHDQELRRR